MGGCAGGRSTRSAPRRWFGAARLAASQPLSDGDGGGRSPLRPRSALRHRPDWSPRRSRCGAGRWAWCCAVSRSRCPASSGRLCCPRPRESTPGWCSRTRQGWECFPEWRASVWWSWCSPRAPGSTACPQGTRGRCSAGWRGPGSQFFRVSSHHVMPWTWGGPRSRRSGALPMRCGLTRQGSVLGRHPVIGGNGGRRRFPGRPGPVRRPGHWHRQRRCAAAPSSWWASSGWVSECCWVPERWSWAWSPG